MLCIQIVLTGLDHHINQLTDTDCHPHWSRPMPFCSSTPSSTSHLKWKSVSLCERNSFDWVYWISFRYWKFESDHWTSANRWKRRKKKSFHLTKKKIFYSHPLSHWQTLRIDADEQLSTQLDVFEGEMNNDKREVEIAGVNMAYPHHGSYPIISFQHTTNHIPHLLQDHDLLHFTLNMFFLTKQRHYFDITQQQWHCQITNLTSSMTAKRICNPVEFFLNLLLKRSTSDCTDVGQPIVCYTCLSISHWCSAALASDSIQFH